jgi:hypothetical protein
MTATGATMMELAPADERAIEWACMKLMVQFAEFNDRQDYEALAALFDERGRFARPTDPNTLIEGRDNILKAFQSRPKGRLTQHLCTNLLVTAETTDRARGSCRILLYTADGAQVTEGAFGIKADPRQLVGIYEDRFVRAAEGWRFAERRGRVLYHTE